MNNEEFSSLVASDARNNASARQYQFLRSAETLDRWRDELVRLMGTIDGQLTGKKAELFFQRRRLGATDEQLRQINAELVERSGDDFVPVGALDEAGWVQIKAEHEQWRTGALRFKRALADRLAECRRLRREQAAEKAKHDEVIRLRRAIETHKSELVDTEEFGDIDQSLWSVLDTITEPG